ncbi:MAG: multidrug ABC transporter permease [Paenibacillaceae bacterium ZCTH02-B3]|nr:MAG: multidrug ABC transporter permease [Paenibacillaceae bacterium ZCTH02-B3]
MEKTIVGPARLFRLIRDARPPKAMIAAAVLFGVLEAASGLAVPLLTMRAVNSFAAGGLSSATLLLVALALIGQAALGGLAYYLMSAIGGRIVAAIRERVWNHVLRLNVGYFDAHESGETMSRVTQDTNVVRGLITNHIITFFTGLLSIAGAVAMLLWIDWKMTLVILLAAVLAVGAMLPIGNRMQAIALAHQDEMAKFSGNLGRVLTNIRLVKAYQAEETELEAGRAQIRNLYRFGLREARILSTLSPLMTLVISLVLILLFGYGGAQVASGALTTGALVAIMFYMVQIVFPFTQMATFFTELQKAVGATERLWEILETPPEEGALAAAEASEREGTRAEGAHFVTDVGHAEELPVQGDIEFENVSFRYGEKPVFESLDLHIPGGKTTALVGASGAGKTTIFSLLERFYEPGEGTIRYAGRPIRSIPLEKWRRLFGYVQQESSVTSGTIRDNVKYGNPDATDEEIIEALKKANAWEFVSRLERGLDTDVGEAGVKLSGGQRQRIAIARALLRDPAILLLDEATSNLDNESEALVQDALQKAMQGRTTIIIAHRLSTVMHADRLVVLENGRVTGIGTHRELMDSHPYYRRLVTRSLKAV